MGDRGWSVGRQDRAREWGKGEVRGGERGSWMVGRSNPGVQGPERGFLGLPSPLATAHLLRVCGEWVVRRRGVGCWGEHDVMRSRRNRVGGEIMEDQDLIGHQLGLMGRNGKNVVMVGTRVVGLNGGRGV